jgi:hypothetical protein
LPGTSFALSLLLGNNIGDEGLADIAAALLTCSSLVELDLSREIHFVLIWPTTTVACFLFSTPAAHHLFRSAVHALWAQ